MKKWFKYAFTAVVLLAAVAAGFFAFQDYQKNKAPVADKQFDKLQTVVSEQHLAQTDLDGIFYNEQAGQFYQWDGNAFSEYPQEVRTVQLNLFGENLTFDLHLAQRDGVYFGFGKAESVMVSYFVKAMNLPSCPIGNITFNTADTLLLLMDGTKGTILQEDRVYSEAFAYQLSTGTVLRQYLDDRLRPTTELGVKRNDYFGFTTEMVQKSTAERIHFLTRANYALSSDPYRLYDLNSTETYFYAGYTPESTLTDIVLNYAYDTEGGIFHFKRGEGEFYAKVGTGTETDQTIATFPGDYLKDYARQGDSMISLKELTTQNCFTVTNARTGEAKKVDLTHTYGQVVTVKMNQAKTKLVILGSFDWSSPKGSYHFQLVTFVDMATGKATQYAGSSLYDVDAPLVQFSGDTPFLYSDGKLCKIEV